MTRALAAPVAHASALALAALVAALPPAAVRAQVAAPAPGAVRAQAAVEMVTVPGGVFRMGSDSMRADERPVHDVVVAAFRLGRTPVTVAQFTAFVEATGYRTEAERGGGCVVFTGRGWETRRGADWRAPGFAQGEDHPVTCVSWDDAQAFVRWLNERTGRAYRLPTEAEWEYAARGGDGAYCEAGLDGIAWHEGNAGGSTHPVGGRRPNAYGLHDLLGSVWEWVSDRYGPYSPGLQTDPTGPPDGAMRVNRGGSWYGAARACWRRGRNTADDRGNGLGFRLAEDVGPGSAGGGPTTGPLTTVVVVRHAERAEDGTADPPLSAAGETRARALAEYLSGARPTGVVVTHYRRTARTAAPAARAHGLEPVVVPVAGGTEAHVRAVADTVRSRFAGGVALVVGHSNTVAGIVAALGGPRLPDLCDTEFSTVFVLVLRPGAEPSVLRSRYGPDDPPPGAACPRP